MFDVTCQIPKYYDVDEDEEESIEEPEYLGDFDDIAAEYLLLELFRWIDDGAFDDDNQLY